MLAKPQRRSAKKSRRDFLKTASLRLCESKKTKQKFQSQTL